MKCRVLKDIDETTYLIPGDCTLMYGDEAFGMDPKEAIKRYCTCDRSSRINDVFGREGQLKRQVDVLEYLLDERQEVINELFRRIKELKTAYHS